jgi:hypothetical protein
MHPAVGIEADTDLGMPGAADRYTLIRGCFAAAKPTAAP